MVHRRRVGALAAICVVLNVVGFPPAAAQPQDAAEILRRSTDVYGALASYADTGSVVFEFGTSSTERHTFSTRFVRAPRGFLLDFNRQGGDRFVVWGTPDAFHTWWKTTGQRFDYPNPNNAPAISQSGRNTMNAALKIPTLLYSRAALGGDFANLADVALAGTDELDGRRCHRITGTARDLYTSGKEINARTMTVWIDVESNLIRQVIEEWPAPPGQRNRTITRYQPRANPALESSTLTFTPPAVGASGASGGGA